MLFLPQEELLGQATADGPQPLRLSPKERLWPQRRRAAIWAAGSPTSGGHTSTWVPLPDSTGVWKGCSRPLAQASLIAHEALFWWVMKGHRFLRLLFSYCDIAVVRWFDVFELSLHRIVG